MGDLVDPIFATDSHRHHDPALIDPAEIFDDRLSVIAEPSEIFQRPVERMSTGGCPLLPSPIISRGSSTSRRFLDLTIEAAGFGY
jgi:hypothetical protein